MTSQRKDFTQVQFGDPMSLLVSPEYGQHSGSHTTKEETPAHTPHTYTPIITNHLYIGIEGLMQISIPSLT